ncbi:MAG: PfkB family carbohydrate kinase [Candidatus Izemoplasmatales bacterium]
MKLNDNEQKILEILKKDPFVNQQYIADQLSLSRSAVANLLSGLQEKGYILGKPYLLRTEEYITCIGGANLDYTFRLEDKLILKTSNPVKSDISYGGVVRNIGENLARLNHKVSLMSVVGDDSAGEDLLAAMRNMMEVFAIDKISREKTGGYYSIINPKGDMDIGFADMSINAHMDRTWILNHKRHLNLSDWIITDTNITKDALEALIEFTRTEEKKLAIIGVSGPKMKNVPEDLNGVEVLICNLDESQAYFKTSSDDLKELIHAWLDKGIKKVVITKGKDAFVYGDNKQVSFQKPLHIKEELINDVTGAGDAFSAALLHALIHEDDFKTAIQYAITNAALTIQSEYSVNPNLSIKLIKKEIKRNEEL